MCQQYNDIIPFTSQGEFGLRFILVLIKINRGLGIMLTVL